MNKKKGQTSKLKSMHHQINKLNRKEGPKKVRHYQRNWINFVKSFPESVPINNEIYRKFTKGRKKM